MSNRPICDEATPDPWMVHANEKFYLTSTRGDRVEIWSSPTMEDFRKCQKSVIWYPKRGSPWSELIWAPELHQLNSRWYIYVSGAHPGQGNKSHRTLVLRSDHKDPMIAASWSFLGPLKGMPDHWAIDATIFNPFANELYCCFSGWPPGDHSDTQQDLFLINLASPEAARSDTLTCISKASLPWERADGGRHGINEGPTWVDMSPDFRGIIYSANGSWTRDYKLAALQLVGSDILQPASWWKRDLPLLISDHRGPFGPGHASFVKPPYVGDYIFCIYHGTEKPDEGWQNRKARAICLQPNHFEMRGRPLCCAEFPLKEQTGYQAPSSGSYQYPGSTSNQYPGNASYQNPDGASNQYQVRGGPVDNREKFKPKKEPKEREEPFGIIDKLKHTWSGI